MSTQSYDQAFDALKRPGWLTFASVVLISVGIMRIFSAISYFSNSHKVNNLSAGLFGDQLWGWGLWDLIIAVLAIWAGYSLLNGNSFGRVIGYIWAGLVLIQSFLILAWAPWFGFLAMMISVLVMFALASTSEWRAQPGDS